jgi:D-3-phosphoglycerate dehydrogenase
MVNTRLTVLAANGFDPDIAQDLESEGIHVIIGDLTADDYIKKPIPCDVLVFRTKMRASYELIQAAYEKDVEYFISTTTGTDHIDFDAAEHFRMAVSYTPVNTQDVVQLVTASMVNLVRDLLRANLYTAKGDWPKKNLVGLRLDDKMTLGVIGCGRIGQEVGRIASTAYGMKVIGYDNDYDSVNRRFKDTSISYRQTLDEVLREADIVTVHISGTERIIAARELALMKPTSYLINAARGQNIDPYALVEALRQCKISGAAIDVFPDEPLSALDILAQYSSESLNNLKLRPLLLSPHIGGNTQQAIYDQSIAAAQLLREYVNGRIWSIAYPENYSPHNYLRNGHQVHEGLPISIIA